ncbi:toll/interleukin-1 receptor (TIR) domain-containing protein [Artemisia annua]|uniref:Toll/interleukin-1 receptor (TIR) domain-containing protein n=1 Tax=Artemisia annua TaxID=35608 RepID=A0A2U1LMM5_ARTAN|nr:toll/interleukin-1 receptor (TIR) domain-containing protein [Artemisia annua]
MEEKFPFDISTNPLYLKVLEESQIAVIVFSKQYADSSWWLDELVYIMNCMHDRGKTVIPIYYDVSPSEVRKQKEVYGNGEFTEINRVGSWRKALVDASNLYGWEIKHTADGYESKRIKLIVDVIMKRLFPDKGLIGVRTRLEDFKYGGGDKVTLASSHGQVERLKIPLQDMLLATNNFSEANVIARSGFGKVYQGQSEQYGIIAIKRLDRRLGQGDPQFMMEIALLTICKHDNIVSLVGFCDQNGEKILVYKYESNGSLDKHLHRKDLTWIQRLHICLDAANGLKYLHDDLEHQHRIVHRDVKSSNILLDDNLKAKISDFGLSKIALANVPCSVIISGACGTPGYVDPVYQDHNILTQKADVYSFGVVLFEVLCGRLVNVRQYQDEHYFSAKLAQNHYEMETLDEIIDSDLRGQINSDSLSTFSSIAYRCLKKHREERPTMSMVVDQLEKALDYQQESSGFLHDVHISFRDRDTECHVVDDLCAALHQEGISTYKDNRTHSRKKSIILKAIERSRCFVIIFTKKFAVNSWYLDEVVKITECVKEKGQFVLPVFYNVSLNDVRTQKGYFGEVMAEYDTHPKMEVWTNALVEVTNSAGLEYSKFW